ncbi:MAG: PhnD/SsuA/transferrin family substrate-binding protein [Hyphomicrobiales bacterium]|uniref:PhnD/SsuA/transferrin family substrate-binding protein n=1 Tax=Rhabdaerophilum calidifontis TaxID=2604328 RepID=UPI001238DC90|nr:PhnD/SsuA/transferrin family substrate-binding protein [Rhabdaerophilum calidifontis]MCA1953292.1 PhnD/SsuA/transferrin family substrate-binding protein [Hyphomicrobiales bacterium]
MLARRPVLAAAFALAAGLVAMPALAQERVRFAVTDVDGMESLQREFGPFKAAFEKASGLKVEFFAVSGRTAAVEAMNADQVDFVLTGPAEYVVFNARLKAQPVVVWERPNYRSSIVVTEESPIKALSELKGRKISFGEIGSTSQHLAPATILADAGLVYGKDYEPVFLKVNVAAEALLRGDIAAIGMNQTHLERVRKAFPERKFRTLGDGAALPNDLVLASAKVDPKVVEKFRNAFRDHGEALLAAIVSTPENKKFSGGRFHYSVSDKDYDPVRKMFVNVGVKEFTKFIGN